jgi:hypothetical protein
MYIRKSSRKFGAPEAFEIKALTPRGARTVARMAPPPVEVRVSDAEFVPGLSLPFPVRVPSHSVVFSP